MNEYEFSNTKVILKSTKYPSPQMKITADFSNINKPESILYFKE